MTWYEKFSGAMSFVQAETPEEAESKLSQKLNRQISVMYLIAGIEPLPFARDEKGIWRCLYE